MNVHDYINTNYNIIFQGDAVNPQHLETVDEILITENHKNFVTKVLTAEFIHQYFQSDVILIEGKLIGQKVNPKDSRQACWLNENLNIKGWDIGSTDELFRMESDNPDLSEHLNQEQREVLADQISTLEKHSLTLEHLSHKVFYDKTLTPDEIEVLISDIAEQAALTTLYAMNRRLSPSDVLKSYESTALRRADSIIKSLSTTLGKKILISHERLLMESKNGLTPRLEEGAQKIQQFLRQRNAIIISPKQEALVKYETLFMPILQKIAEAAIVLVQQNVQKVTAAATEYLLQNPKFIEQTTELAAASAATVPGNAND